MAQRLLRPDKAKGWAAGLACLLGGWLSAAEAWGQQVGGIESVGTTKNRTAHLRWWAARQAIAEELGHGRAAISSVHLGA